MPIANRNLPVEGDLVEYVRNIPWGEEDRPRRLVLASLVSDPRVNLVWRLEPMGGNSQLAVEALEKILPKNAVPPLLAVEGQLFTWLRKDKSNPTRFVMDPLGSLEEAGIKLDERTVEALRRHRENQKRTYDTSEAKNIASLRIEVAPSKSKPKKN